MILKKNKEERKRTNNDKNTKYNYVRVKLYTPTPGCKSND